MSAEASPWSVSGIRANSDLRGQLVVATFPSEPMITFGQTIADGRFLGRRCENCHRRGQSVFFDCTFRDLGALLQTARVGHARAPFP